MLSWAGFKNDTKWYLFSRFVCVFLTDYHFSASGLPLPAIVNCIIALPSWAWNLGKGYAIFVCVYTDIFFKLCIFLTKDFSPINWIAVLLLPFILSIEILPNCIDTKEDKALFVPLLESANNPVSDSADVLVLVCCILAQ